MIERSFAVVRVGPGTEAAVAGAWGAARALFSGAPTGEAGGRGGREGDEAEAEAFVREHQRTAGGDLLGYALPPGGAKALFRAACSGWGERAGQPWPSLEGEEEGGEGSSLRSSSLAAAEVMHSLLVDVLDEIRTAVREEEEEEEEWGSGGGGHPDPPRKKRPRIPDPPRYEVDVPRTFREATYCPLDYFFYHGRDPALTNCSEHVDRGVLICVALTDVAGLEVLPRDAAGGCGGRRAFVCPELLSRDEALRSERGESGCGSLVCVMAGDQLAAACRRPRSCAGAGAGAGGSRPPLSACVHRVRNGLGRARLSVTYELRGRWVGGEGGGRRTPQVRMETCEEHLN